MAKYKIYGNLDITGDIVELDDDMTDEEIEQELWEYVSDKMDWNFRRVEEDERN